MFCSRRMNQRKYINPRPTHNKLSDIIIYFKVGGNFITIGLSCAKASSRFPG